MGLKLKWQTETTQEMLKQASSSLKMWLKYLQLSAPVELMIFLYDSPRETYAVFSSL